MWGDNEKTVICKPGRGLSSEMDLLASWFWAFQTPELWEINVFYLNHSDYGIIIAPWTDSERFSYKAPTKKQPSWHLDFWTSSLLNCEDKFWLFEADAESSASVHQCQIESQRQSFGWSRKELLYCFPRQRGTQWALVLETVCPNPRELGEGFDSNGSRVGLLIGLKCVQGLHSFNLASSGLLIFSEECFIK